MGVGVQNQTAGENADIMAADQLTLMRIMAIELRENNRLLRNEKKEWLTAAEVNQMLGFRSNSRAHQFAREKGHLTILGSKSPLTYWREEVEQLVQKVARNEVFLGAKGF